MNNTVTMILMVTLVALSSFFSASETAFTSVSKSKLTMLADKKNKKAARAVKLLDKYDSLLSTILVGNNIVNIALTSIATVFFIEILAGEKSAEVASTISTVVVTLVVLIFGEVTPKSLSKENPEKYCMAFTPILTFFTWIFLPINFVFSLLKKLLGKIFRNKGDRRVTDEELITIVEEACEEGGIDDQESELIRSAIEFNDRNVSEIITPRIDVVAVADDATLDEVTETFRKSMFSRLPVYKESIDNIIGIVLEKESCYYEENEANGRFDVTKHMNTPVFLSEATKVGSALKIMQKQKAQMAIVIDEYGGTLGIVTVEDILEELVGEIWDEYDDVEEDLIKIDENTHKVLGSAPTSKLFRELDMDEDEESEAATVSGWAIEKLGRIPRSGDKFTYENFKVEVLGTDPKRIESLLVTVLPTEEDKD